MRTLLFILALCLYLSLTSCSRFITAQDGKTYYKVGHNDYIPAASIDSLNYEIWHYQVVGKL